MTKCSLKDCEAEGKWKAVAHIPLGQFSVPPAIDVDLLICDGHYRQVSAPVGLFSIGYATYD